MNGSIENNKTGSVAKKKPTSKTRSRGLVNSYKIHMIYHDHLSLANVNDILDDNHCAAQFHSSTISIKKNKTI